MRVRRGRAPRESTYSAASSSPIIISLMSMAPRPQMKVSSHVAREGVVSPVALGAGHDGHHVLVRHELYGCQRGVASGDGDEDARADLLVGADGHDMGVARADELMQAVELGVVDLARVHVAHGAALQRLREVLDGAGSVEVGVVVLVGEVGKDAGALGGLGLRVLRQWLCVGGHGRGLLLVFFGSHGAYPTPYVGALPAT